MLATQANLLSGACEFGIGVLLEQMRWTDEQIATEQPDEGQLEEFRASRRRWEKIREDEPDPDTGPVSPNFRLPLRLPPQELLAAERRLQQLQRDGGSAESRRMGAWATAGAGAEELREALQQVSVMASDRLCSVLLPPASFLLPFCFPSASLLLPFCFPSASLLIPSHPFSSHPVCFLLLASGPFRFPPTH